MDISIWCPRRPAGGGQVPVSIYRSGADAPYWDMAKQYVLAEHMFTTQGGSSFTAHQDLIAGGTVIEPDEALVNLPSCAGSKCVWGCDAPKGTHTSLITQDDEFNRDRDRSHASVTKRCATCSTRLRSRGRTTCQMCCTKRQAAQCVRCDQGRPLRSAGGRERREAADQRYSRTSQARPAFRRFHG